jgi:hypothetical protein
MRLASLSKIAVNGQEPPTRLMKVLGSWGLGELRKYPSISAPTKRGIP